MAQDEGTATVKCPNCDELVSDIQLRTCSMCRSLFCQHCSQAGFGREFCGVNCRDMFFFGDGEESEEDF